MFLIQDAIKKYLRTFKTNDAVCYRIEAESQLTSIDSDDLLTCTMTCKKLLKPEQQVIKRLAIINDTL